jgi:ribulose-phosphate 3-epimerase
MKSHEIYIAPSILSADFTHLGDELASIAEADYVHYDVMDGHFVPNLSFGPDILRQVKAATSLPLDVHLMVSNPEEVVEAYLKAGADLVGFHWEAQTHAHKIVSQIHAAGAKACISLNPATPVSVLEAIIDDLDMVLLMSVNPGFGGQSFIESSYKKIAALRRLCAQHAVCPRIEVDGGISVKNVRAIVAAGADTLVAGSAIFGANDRAAEIARLRHEAKYGRQVQA